MNKAEEKKELGKAIDLINKRHGTKHFKPIMLTLDVIDIAKLMVEFAKPYKRALNKAIGDCEQNLD